MSKIFDSTHAKQGEIKLSKEYKRYLIRRRLAIIFTIILTVAMTSAIIFVLAKKPVKTNEMYIFAEQSSRYEIGDVVLVTEDSSFLGQLKNAVVNTDVIVGKVVAGPYGKITPLGNDKYRVRDNDFEAYVDIKDVEQEFLSKEYVIQIQYSSKSTADELYDIIVSDNMVVGKNPSVDLVNAKSTGN